jgi:heat-inducible transcriptional repressor
MSDLEEMALLSQPHTSAGRVPTDAAFRLYVDVLLSARRVRVGGAEEERIARALAGTHGEIPAVMEEASRLLSALSGNVGIVLAPDLTRAVFETMDFVRLDGRRVLAVIVDPAGMVTHRLVETIEDISQTALDGMARFLTEQFAGLTLLEARARIVSLMAEEKARYDQVLGSALALAERVFEGHGPEAPGVFLEGTPNLVGQPGFASAEAMRDLFRAFEEKSRLVEILNGCLRSGGMTVRIGSENDDPRLRRCAVLAAPYGLPGRVLGAVGIIGPVRMEYDRAIPLVESLSRALGQTIAQQGNAP